MHICLFHLHNYFCFQYNLVFFNKNIHVDVQVRKQITKINQNAEFATKNAWLLNMYRVSEACSSSTSANGLLSDKATQINKAKESVSFTCIAGYIPIKVWSPVPFCNIVNCTVSILNNNQYITEPWVSANELTYTYGTTLNIQCKEWYEITNGSDSLTCQEDGTWNPSPPQCVKIICNLC